MIGLAIIGIHILYYLVSTLIIVFACKYILKKYNQYQYLLIASLLIPTYWLPFWPYLGGEQWHNYRCENNSGEKIYKTVYAESYFNASYHTKNRMKRSINFNQSLKDLISERIVFFETEGPYFTYPRSLAPKYKRFSLKKIRDPLCSWYRNNRKRHSQLKNLGLDTDSLCLAMEKTDTLRSTYYVGTRGKHYSSDSAITYILNRSTGELISSFKSYHLKSPLMGDYLYSKKCPKPYNKLSRLTEHTFLPNENSKSMLSKIRENYLSGSNLKEASITDNYTKLPVTLSCIKVAFKSINDIEWMKEENNIIYFSGPHYKGEFKPYEKNMDFSSYRLSIYTEPKNRKLYQVFSKSLADEIAIQCPVQ